MSGKKAIGYLRVSGLGQVKGDGFPRQRKAVEAWAKANKVEIVQWYREPGVSGTLVDRPALARLLVDLKENDEGIQYVVVENLDRLARELYVQETILRDIKDLGVTLISATQGDLDSDPSRVLVRQIFGAVSEYEKAMIVLKLRAARDRKREENGRCEGVEPFGFYEGEQEAIDLVGKLRRKRFGKRLSFGKIAKALDEEGIRTRSGRPWNASTVRKIVHVNFPGMAA